jgi:hypothetical protein
VPTKCRSLCKGVFKRTELLFRLPIKLILDLKLTWIPWIPIDD